MIMKTKTKSIAVIIAALILSQVNTAYAQQKRSVLIGFKGPSTRQAANERADAVRSIGGAVHHAFHVIPVVSAELPEAAIAQLRKRADVTYVEDDIEWHADSQTMPWGIDRIRAPIAWSVATGAGIDVAVLDSGIDYDHEDLADNLGGGISWVGKGKKDGSTDPSLYNDVYGHGTHCAGTIAAVNNGIGVVGVAPQARIWAVKVLGDDGSGRWTDIAQGVEWCIDSGYIRVISMSLGGGYSATLDNACAAAYAADILIVASAGNEGGAVHYPAAYNSVMAISAINSSDQLASFSNRGPEIELAAPGVGVLSTVPGDAYQMKNGTSMACPHVSGVAALLWESMSSASSIRDQLKATALDIGLGSDEQGFGLVNATASQGPITDLAITSVFAAQTMVLGTTAPANAVVKNVGDTVVEAGVGVIVEDTTVPFTVWTGITSSALAPGDEEQFSFPYNAKYPIGGHILQASHNLTDDYSANDSLTRIVQIEALFIDVAISAVSAPSSSIQGDGVSVEVTVENRSNWSVNDINVDLMDGGTLIGTQIVSGLGIGASTILTFNWDTATASPGEHTLTASHDFIDDDGSNDSKVTTVEITEPGSFKYMYASVDFTTAGPHLKIIITVEESDQTPVEGIEVYAELDGGQLPMAVTDSVGQVTYTLKGGASGGHDVFVYDLFDTRDPAAYVADGLPILGTW